MLADAERRTLSQILGMMARTASHENEANEQYLARLAEGLLLDTLAAQFVNGRLPIHDVRNLFSALGDAIAHAISPSSSATRDDSIHEGSSGNAASARRDAAARRADARSKSAGRRMWREQRRQKAEEATPESYAEILRERFWDQLPAREKATVLARTRCLVRPRKISRALHLAVCGSRVADPRGDASSREARIVLLNYSRALAAEEPRPRRVVASTLLELIPLIERLWPEESPAEIDRAAARSLIARNFARHQRDAIATGGSAGAKRQAQARIFAIRVDA